MKGERFNFLFSIVYVLLFLVCINLRVFAENVRILRKNVWKVLNFALVCGGLKKCARARIFLHSFSKLNFFVCKRRVFLYCFYRDLIMRRDKERREKWRIRRRRCYVFWKRGEVVGYFCWVYFVVDVFGFLCIVVWRKGFFKCLMFNE